MDQLWQTVVHNWAGAAAFQESHGWTLVGDTAKLTRWDVSKSHQADVCSPLNFARAFRAWQISGCCRTLRPSRAAASPPDRATSLPKVHDEQLQGRTRKHDRVADPPQRGHASGTAEGDARIPRANCSSRPRSAAWPIWTARCGWRAARDGQPARYLLSPMVFAKLVQLADVKATDKVLDVGAATGYSTAILARLARR